MNVYVIAIVLTALWMLRRNASRIKGHIGERRVARQLARLDPEEYRVINGLLIVDGNTSSQIDHLVVSRFGIFVIETKNFKGYISGGETSQYWTQYVYGWKNRFRNPIKQNQSHICALRHVLPEYGREIYHPVVVFAGSARLGGVYSSFPVVYARDLLRTIAGRRGTACLSPGQIDGIVQELTGSNRKDRNTKRQHVYRVRRQVYERQRMERAGICPRCGARLVPRQGKYGRFYGCSNYPACKYTLPR